MIVPLYNSEVSPPEVRGALVALQQLAITFGIMISFWIGYGTNYIGGTELHNQSDAAWLVPICIQIAPCLVLLGGMAFMPFSPRWLIHHDREDEAREILANLRDLPADHELVQLEFLEIKAQSTFEKRSIAEQFPHLKEATAWNVFKLQFVAINALFKTKAMFKRVIVACLTMVCQQWCGINAYVPLFIPISLHSVPSSHHFGVVLAIMMPKHRDVGIVFAVTRSSRRQILHLIWRSYLKTAPETGAQHLHDPTCFHPIPYPGTSFCLSDIVLTILLS